MRILSFIKKFFSWLLSGFNKVIETQREIVSEAKKKDERLMVRQDLVNPDNYTSVEYDGFKITMRKIELPAWEGLNRAGKRHYVSVLKNKIRKGELVYKDYGNGLKLLTDPKLVLNPMNE